MFSFPVFTFNCKTAACSHSVSGFKNLYRKQWKQIFKNWNRVKTRVVLQLKVKTGNRKEKVFSRSNHALNVAVDIVRVSFTVFIELGSYTALKECWVSFQLKNRIAYWLNSPNRLLSQLITITKHRDCTSTNTTAIKKYISSS